MSTGLYWRCTNTTCKCIVVGSVPNQLKRAIFNHQFEEHENMEPVQDPVIHFYYDGVIEIDR